MSSRRLVLPIAAALLASCGSDSVAPDSSTPGFELVVTDSVGGQHYLKGADATWTNNATETMATLYLEENMYSDRDPLRVDLALWPLAGGAAQPGTGQYPLLSPPPSGGLSVLYGANAGSRSYTASAGAIQITHSTATSLTGTIDMFLIDGTTPGSPGITVQGRFQAIRRQPRAVARPAHLDDSQSNYRMKRDCLNRRFS